MHSLHFPTKWDATQLLLIPAKHNSYTYMQYPVTSYAGTLIRRHRINKPAPDDDLFYTVEDFNVGEQIVLHGRPFQITVRLYYCVHILQGN